MQNRVIQAGAVAASMLAFASASSADIKINENLDVSGYIVGSARISDQDQAATKSTMDLDATKLALTAKFAPVTGKLSFYAGSDNDPVVLDAYFTYDLGNGSSVTAGKFLSWLGYEAFDAVNMTQLTYAWQALPGENLAGIPAYHSGVKIESSGSNYSAGFAVLDSNNYTSPFHKGDGDLDNGPGLEAYYTYKAGALTVFTGLAYDKNEDSDEDVYSGNIWAQYVVGKTTLAAEYSHFVYDGKAGSWDKDAYQNFYQVFAKQQLCDKCAISVRYANGVADSSYYSRNAKFDKFTVAPAIAVTANLEIVGELSYIKYKNTVADDATFAGVQARFKF